MSGNDSRPGLTAAVLLASFAPWTPAAAQECAVLKGHTASVGAVAFAPDGKTLATASADRTVRLWDAQTGESKAVLKGHRQGVRSLAFSPDGKTLASGSQDGTVRLWDVAKSLRCKPPK